MDEGRHCLIFSLVGQYIGDLNSWPKDPCVKDLRNSSFTKGWFSYSRPGRPSRFEVARS